MGVVARFIETPFGGYLYDPWSGSLTLLDEQGKLAIKDYVSPDQEGDEIVLDEDVVLPPLLANLNFGNPVEKIAYPDADSVLRRLDRNINLMILQITQKCNLRCRYCIYSADNEFNRNHSNKVIDFEEAKKAIDFLKDHSVDSEQITIGLYGGEPFLHFNLMKKIVEYADMAFEGKKVVFHVTTNGTLLRDEVIEFLISERSRFHVLFSLDGPESIQDASRCFPDGSGTYATVVDGIRRLVQRCPEYKEKLRFNSVVDTEKDYCELVKICDEEVLRGAAFQFNYLEKNGVPAPFNSDFIESHEYDMFLGYVAHYRGSRTGYPNELIRHEFRHITEGIRRFVQKSSSPMSVPAGVCQPGLTRMFVTVSGDIFPCERVDETSDCMRIGTIQNGFSKSRIISLLNVASLCEEKCKRCWAFNLCSSCAKRFDGGDGLSADGVDQACPLSRRAANDRLGQVILLNENERHERKMRRALSMIGNEGGL